MKGVDHICGDHWEHFGQRQESLELEQSLSVFAKLKEAKVLETGV